MIIRVNISRSDDIKKIKVNKNSTIQDLLDILDLKPDTVIILRNNIPIPVDEILDKDQELSIIEVSSGG